MPKLTVTVITLNEATHITECLASVAWADEILVVDSGSTDGTPDLARARGGRVIVKDWPGYSAQKNFAAGEAANDWIYRIPRVTWHLGRWIRTTDWYPDYQLRLYDRRRARWKTTRVHESVEADAEPGRLTHDLQHFAYRDIAHHHQTMDRYTTLAAQAMFEAGRRAGVVDLVLHPPAAFLRNYLLKRGCLDGIPGLIISTMNAHYVFLKLAKLWALGRRD